MSQFDDVCPHRMVASVSSKWTAYENLSSYDYAIGMWLAEMDYRIDPVVQDFIFREARESNFGYISSRCVERVQSATADFLAGFGCDADPSRVVLVADVLASLRLTIDHFTRPGSPVVVSTPAYMPFTTLPQEHGREVIEVPSIFDNGTWRLDYEGIERAFAAGAQLYVLCNPWNPAGRVFSRAELERLSSIVDAAGGRVFEDCIHLPLVLDSREATIYASLSEATRSHTTLAVAASKGWNIPGLKCAQMYFPNEKDAAAFGPKTRSVTGQASTLGAKAAVVCYEEGKPWNTQLRTYLAANRDLLQRRVSSWKGVEMANVEGTYIAFLDFSGAAAAGVFGEFTPAQFFARNAGVSLTEGRNCGKGYENYGRMIFATSRAILSEALDRMENALAP